MKRPFLVKSQWQVVIWAETAEDAIAEEEDHLEVADIVGARITAEEQMPEQRKEGE
jgi:hypothetical protein